jgi:hypothetical protein
MRTIDELQKAFALAGQQSENEQAMIAARIREVIEAGTRWVALLSDPESLDMFEDMAEEAHQEYLRGETKDIQSQFGGGHASVKSRRTRRFRDLVTGICMKHCPNR